MARKLRLEYPGAVYHVINRGNYRTNVFQSEGAKAASWKVTIAVHLKETTQASNPWLAERLGFGRPAYASRLISALRRQSRPGPELTNLRAKCAA